MKLTSFFGQPTSMFFRRKGRIPTLLLTFALPKVVDRYCCQKIQGHFAAKQNKIAKAK